jgi:hypothetical protein
VETMGRRHLPGSPAIACACGARRTGLFGSNPRNSNGHLFRLSQHSYGRQRRRNHCEVTSPCPRAFIADPSRSVSPSAFAPIGPPATSSRSQREGTFQCIDERLKPARRASRGGRVASATDGRPQSRPRTVALKAEWRAVVFAIRGCPPPTKTASLPGSRMA